MKNEQHKNKNFLGKKDSRKIKKIIKSCPDTRELKRAVALRMNNEGYTAVEIGNILGISDKTVRNIRNRYEATHLNAALYDRVRGGQPQKFGVKKIQRITAVACSKPPDGYSRWTLDLLKEHVVKKGIVDQVSREEIRIILRDHDLKPWQKKMWCIPEINEEYIEKMEDVLAVYEKPYDKKEPVVCLDEKPVQLLGNVREPTTMKSGKPARQDYEYKKW
jgi:transposase